MNKNNPLYHFDETHPPKVDPIKVSEVLKYYYMHQVKENVHLSLQGSDFIKLNIYSSDSDYRTLIDGELTHIKEIDHIEVKVYLK